LLLRAKQSFSMPNPFGYGMLSVKKGSLVDDDHELVKSHGHYFEPAEATIPPFPVKKKRGRPVKVEQATQAPGEVRTVYVPQSEKVDEGE